MDTEVQVQVAVNVGVKVNVNVIIANADEDQYGAVDDHVNVHVDRVLGLTRPALRNTVLTSR